MVGMGFTMGKGVYGDVFAELFAGPVSVLRELRVNLSDPDLAFSDWGLIDLIKEAPSLGPWRTTHYQAGGLSKDDWKAFAEAHFREDWFASHEWQGPQQVPGLPKLITPTEYRNLEALGTDEHLAYKERASTGGWKGWDGDAEAIVREGLIRAIDACLGEDSPGSGASSPRQLAVDFKWVCGGHRFDWWVTWDDGTAYRPVPNESPVPPDKVGRVVVTLLTPGMDGDPLLADWYQDPPGSPAAPDPRLREYHVHYADPPRLDAPTAAPPPMAAATGQIVVGQPVVRVAVKSSSRTLQPMGQIAVPAQAINKSMASEINRLQDEAQMGFATVVVPDDSKERQERPPIAVVSPSPGELGLFQPRTN